MELLENVLERYRFHPQFIGAPLTSVNARGAMGDTLLHLACDANGNPNALREVECLIKAGADVNARGDRGFTPLHIAVRSGTPEIVFALLKGGAGIEIRDDDGQTVLDAASYVIDPSIRDLLRNQGA